MTISKGTTSVVPTSLLFSPPKPALAGGTAAPLRGAQSWRARTQRSAPLHAGLNYVAPPALTFELSDRAALSSKTQIPHRLKAIRDDNSKRARELARLKCLRENRVVPGGLDAFIPLHPASRFAAGWAIMTRACGALIFDFLTPLPHAKLGFHADTEVMPFQIARSGQVLC